MGKFLTKIMAGTFKMKFMTINLKVYGNVGISKEINLKK